MPEWRVEPLDQAQILFSVAGVARRPRGFRSYFLLYQWSFRWLRSLEVEPVLEELNRLVHLSVAARPVEKLALRGLAVELEERAHLYLGAAAVRAGERVGQLRARGAKLLASRHVFLDFNGIVHPYHDGPAALELEPARQPYPLAAVRVEGPARAQLTPGQTAWHLFAHLQNYTAARENLSHLAEIVRLNQVRGISLAQEQKQHL
ncbi:MAG: hypothetical protein AB7S38_17675 [Vulcanimicrobiota bacterium]